MENNIEIMSPVGSYESLMAAINAGAGSVYFGAGKLNMRSRSSQNFTLDDLENIADICTKHGVRSYIAVNTVIYDHEIEDMKSILDTAKKAGISAVIATDHAVIDYANEIDFEVHLSTQLNISNYSALAYYSQFADVAVLARELNLDQVAHIARQIRENDLRGKSGKPMRLEVFVHGALCMSISGKCYLSLHEKNYSANRGACIQTCRRKYTVTDQATGNELEIDNEYIMSPKDLSTIAFIDKILAAGVTVLKIEGRGRSPEYVRTVTECYREAVEAVLEDTYSQDKIDSWTERLSEVFNRGFWDGYYLGQTLGEWTENHGSSAKKRKIYLGKGKNYYSKIKVAAFQIEADTLSIGDEILITGPTTGAEYTVVKELRFDDKIIEQAEKGMEVSFPLEFAVRESDKLYKIVDQSQVTLQ